MPTRLPAFLPPAAPALRRLLVGPVACLVALNLVLLLAACSDAALDGSADPATASATAAGGLPAAKAVRFVKLEELSELNGHPWASVAEFNLIDSTGATVDRRGWTVRADSSNANDAPTNAIDGDPKSLWHTLWDAGTAAPPTPPHELVVALGAPVKLSGFRYLPRQDAITNGIIARYRFYVSNDGVDWGKPVSSGDFSAMGPTHQEKTVLFAGQTTNHAPVVTAPPAQTTTFGKKVSLQIAAIDADSDALQFEAERLPSGLRMSPTTGLITGAPIVPGSYSVNVRVKDNKGSEASAAFQWLVQSPAAADTAPKAAPGEVRFVKLEQLSEINGRQWASIAEFNLLDAAGANLPRGGWTAGADSAENNEPPGNAIDDNPASLWHTQWDGDSPPPPHSFIVDLGKPVKVHGFRYLPRQDSRTNGIIAKYRFYTSVDGVNWGKPVAEGDLSVDGSPSAEKTILLK